MVRRDLTIPPERGRVVLPQREMHRTYAVTAGFDKLSRRCLRKS